jgi:CubicO group peptidase (beta-lactamase class C family)
LLATFAGVVTLAAVATAADPAFDPATLRQSSFEWTQAQREFGFGHWDSIFAARVVEAGASSRPLPGGPPLDVFRPGTPGADTLDRFMAEQKVAGLLVLHRGEVRLERYTSLYPPGGRWVSQSVAKTITGTLVGVALQDGYITSLDDPLTKYLPALRGGGYDGVTIRQALTMTSGVRWDEGYAGASSDLAHFYADPVDTDFDATVSYMRKRPRVATAGTRWNYSTGETHLLGALLATATHRALADYLSERIWTPYGMEHFATWSTDRSDAELAGCCLQATLRDFARFGQFVLEGGRIHGRAVVPPGWFAEATRASVATPYTGRGYGYLWWVRTDGSFDAIGIHGQLLHVDPSRELVVVIASAWPEATSPERSVARDSLLQLISTEASPPGASGETSENP